MTFSRIILTGSALALAAACGGGGTSAGGGATGYAAQLASFGSDFDASTITPEPDLPTGSATYRGVVGLNTTDIDSIDITSTTSPADLVDRIEGFYGALVVNVDFAGDTLGGSVTNFQDFNGSNASGRLDITNGSLTGTNNVGIGNGFEADAAGTIAGDAYTFEVDGMFTGESGEGLAIYFGSTGSNEAVGSGFAAR